MSVFSFTLLQITVHFSLALWLTLREDIYLYVPFHYHLAILKLHIMTFPHFVDIEWQSIKYHGNWSNRPQIKSYNIEVVMGKLKKIKNKYLSRPSRPPFPSYVYRAFLLAMLTFCSPLYTTCLISIHEVISGVCEKS